MLYGAPISAGVHQNLIYMTQRNTTVKVYPPGAYNDDNSAYVPLNVTTAWYKLGGIQGFQRVRWATLLMDNSATDFDLTIQVGYDYNSSYTDTFSFTSTELAAMDQSGQQVKIHIPTQRCQSIRFNIADSKTNAGSNVKGPVLVGMSLEVGLKRGLMKRPAAHMK